MLLDFPLGINPVSVIASSLNRVNIPFKRQKCSSWVKKKKKSFPKSAYLKLTWYWKTERWKWKELENDIAFKKSPKGGRLIVLITNESYIFTSIFIEKKLFEKQNERGNPWSTSILTTLSVQNKNCIYVLAANELLNALAHSWGRQLMNYSLFLVAPVTNFVPRTFFQGVFPGLGSSPPTRCPNWIRFYMQYH